MSINQTIYNLPNKVNALAVNSKKFTQFTVFFFVRVGSKNETSIDEVLKKKDEEKVHSK